MGPFDLVIRYRPSSGSRTRLNANATFLDAGKFKYTLNQIFIESIIGVEYFILFYLFNLVCFISLFSPRFLRGVSFRVCVIIHKIVIQLEVAEAASDV